MSSGFDIDVLLVTGLSGAGRGTSAKVLEDLGWYVADNLPPALISNMVDLGRADTDPIRRLAVVLDARTKTFSGDLHQLREQLANKGVYPRVLFLDAADATLIKRFEQVRRAHPLQDDGTLSEGITAERRLLDPVKAEADLVIDTSSLSVHRLREAIEGAFTENILTEISVTVQSFGFKNGIPIDADMVADVRFLPNPHWIPELRTHSGLDSDVSDYVLGRPEADRFIASYLDVLTIVFDGYRRESKRYVTVGIGCTGGKHRSVAVSEALGRRIRGFEGVSVRVTHRDLGLE